MTGTSIELYEDAGKLHTNVGRLITSHAGEDRVSTCTVTLIGMRGEIGIALTAAHCIDEYNRTFNQNGVIPKCSSREVSFASEDTETDPHRVPVLGSHAVGRFIDNPGLFIGDVGVVFLDLSKYSLGIKALSLDPEFSEDDNHLLAEIVGYGQTLLNSSDERGANLEVVGYGQQHLLDGLEATKRRAMSTEGKLSRRKDGELLMYLSSDTAINNQGCAPVGKGPAKGDSGGPIIDIDKKHIVGVVSYAILDSGKSSAFALPIYPYQAWIQEQITKGSQSFLFRPAQSQAFLSRADSWEGGRVPGDWCSPYGESHSMVFLRSGHELVLDTDVPPHIVRFNGERSGLKIDANARHLNTVEVETEARISSYFAEEGSLTLENLLLRDRAKVEIDSSLHIESQLYVGRGVRLDLAKKNTDLKLSMDGKIVVEGELKVKGLKFNKDGQAYILKHQEDLNLYDRLLIEYESELEVYKKAVKYNDTTKDTDIKWPELSQKKRLQEPAKPEAPRKPQWGRLTLAGQLSVNEGVTHSDHTIAVSSGAPGRINGDYNLRGGTMELELDSLLSPSSVLSVSGNVSLDSGNLRLSSARRLNVGDEFVLIESMRGALVYSHDSLNKEIFEKTASGEHMLEVGATLQFDSVSEPNKLKLRVIPLEGGSISLGGGESNLMLH